jgi:hypothetical protein
MDGEDEVQPGREPEREEEGAAPAPRRRRKRRRLFDARAQAVAVKALARGATYAEAAKAAGFAVSTLHAARARDAGFDEACGIAVEESSGDVLIAPGKGRKLQYRRGRRRPFGPKLQDLFLEHFAATCNIEASAEAAGVGRSTVNKHLAEDADFRARFDRVLEFAYCRLDAELVRQRIEAAERPQTDGDEAFRAAEFERALQLLREHKRGRPGGPDRRPGAAPTHAGLDEVCLALARQLKKFPPTAPPAAEAQAGEDEAEGEGEGPDPSS